MLEDGIISEVESSAGGTPIVTPLKPDGKTPRICGDYRLTLNRSLLQQNCTTKEPKDVLHKLNGASVSSKIDLQNAFLQLLLDDNSKAFWIVCVQLFAIWTICVTVDIPENH